MNIYQVPSRQTVYERMFFCEIKPNLMLEEDKYFELKNKFILCNIVIIVAPLLI